MGLSKRSNYTTGSNEAIFLMCKAYTKGNDINSAKGLINSVFGEERVRLLLVISEFYILDKVLPRAELDKAYPFMIHAKTLSDSVHSKPWLYETLLLFGKYYFKTGDFEKGKNSVLQITTDCKKNGNIQSKAHYYSVFICRQLIAPKMKKLNLI